MQRRFDSILAGISGVIGDGNRQDQAFLLAVSGGVDSMCMAELFLNSSLKVRFALAHCNFHLRGEESDGDEDLVSGWASDNGIVLHRKDFDTESYAAGKGLSIEMAARELRYMWFHELCAEYGYTAVAVAHNANDNAETLFLNMIRGTGLKGMCGMREVSAIPVAGQGVLVRPLLSFTRDQIEGFARRRGLVWRNDRTNAETEYRRNRIRNLVFPILEKMNPSFIKTLNREISYLYDVKGIVDGYCSSEAEAVAERSGNNISISIPRLLGIRTWRPVLYHLLEPYGFNSSVVSSLGELLASDRTVGGKRFESADYELVTSSRELTVRKKPCTVSEIVPPKHGTIAGMLKTSADEPVMVVRGDGTYHFNGVTFSVRTMAKEELPSLKVPAGTIVFDRKSLDFPFVCRRWMHGDWFRPLGLGGRKKVSDFFTDRKYGLPEKERAIVIAGCRRGQDSSHISAILGERIDGSIRVTGSTLEVTVIRIETDNL